jgi:tetratricopeptide (TPR) repeat protein
MVKESADALTERGREQVKKKDFHAAREHFERALLLHRAVDHSSYDVASALHDVGHASFHLGEHERARTHLEESLQLKRRHYLRTGESSRNMDLAVTLEVLGHVHAALADWSAAKRAYSEALDTKRVSYGSTVPSGEKLQRTGSLGMKQQYYGYDLSQNVDIANTIHHLAVCAHQQQQYHKARNKYLEALQMYSAEHERHVAMARILSALAHVSADMGKQAHAAAYFEQAVAMMVELVEIEPHEEHHAALQEIRDQQRDHHHGPASSNNADAAR